MLRLRVSEPARSERNHRYGAAAFIAVTSIVYTTPIVTANLIKYVSTNPRPRYPLCPFLHRLISQRRTGREDLSEMV
jgi:hypothetical protein